MGGSGTGDYWGIGGRIIGGGSGTGDYWGIGGRIIGGIVGAWIGGACGIVGWGRRGIVGREEGLGGRQV